MLTPEMIAAIAAFVTALGGIAWTGYTARRQSEVADATTKVQGAAAVIDGYDDLCGSLRAEIDRLQESDVRKDAQIARLQERIGKNDTEIAGLETKVAELTTALRKADAEKAHLTDEVERQRTKIICLERDNESLRAEIAELRQQQQSGGRHATE